MRHAGTETIRQLEPLLVRLRAIDGLVERRPGIFYRDSRAFLHFHEDPTGVFADIRLDGIEFERVAVTDDAFEAIARRVALAVERSPARRTGR